jgi:hypothetical protein
VQRVISCARACDGSVLIQINPPCFSHHQSFSRSCPERAMLDAILIATGVGFFVVAVLYVVACERM